MASIVDRITSPFRPPVETVRHYSVKKLKRDVVAGLTVSVVEIPQAMAYAIIAGVPPQYGIYTSIIQGVVGALLSSSEHMTTGPTNTQALLVASAMAQFSGLTPEQYLALVCVLTLMKGLFQLAFFAARMGDFVKYVSKSVIAGLTAGAGVLIVVGQLPGFLGVQTHRVEGEWHGVVGAVQRLVPRMGDVNWRAIVIGVGCLAIVVASRRISKFVPGSLIAVVAGAVVMYLCGWLGVVPAIGELPGGFAHFAVPAVSSEAVRDLAGGALALAILGMIESVAIAKSIAAKTGEKISANQEFFAQGFKNTLTSFFQCIPGSGSFTRSALDYAAGAETRFAAVFNAMFVATIFFLLRDGAKYIPMAGLAAVLFVVAAGLIDYGYIRRIARTSRSDTIVCAITFLATLLAPLEYAIFIGVFLNVALYMRSTSRLQMNQILPTAEGPFREAEFTDRSGNRRVLLLQLEGNLFFGLVDELQERFARILQLPEVGVVIFRLKRAHEMDSTILSELEKFSREMHAHGKYVVLCGVKPAMLTRLRAFGIVDLLGEENVFAASTGSLFESVRRALKRAEKLIGASIDTKPDGSLPENFNYEI